MEIPTGLTTFVDHGLELIYSLGPAIEPTLVLVPDALRSHVAALSEQTGFDVRQVCFALSLLMCYPFGMVMNLLPYGQARHIFSFLMGAFLLQFVMDIQWIHQLIASLVVYILFVVLPRKSGRIAVPLFVSLYLFAGHLHRQYTNYLGWDLDFTASMMVLMQKSWMMAFNLYDGELLSKDCENRAARKCAPFALRKLPSLIEFLGYTFCFSSVLCGPCFEFSIYRSACEGSHMFSSCGLPRANVPSNVWVTLKPFLFSLACMGMHIFGRVYYPLHDPQDPQKNLPVLLTDGFLAMPFLRRYSYFLIGAFFDRLKYYFAWKISEGANNLWYLGFEGFDDKQNPKGWGNSVNVDMVAVELSPNIQNLTKGWNKKTSLWLQRYVYFRTNGSLIAVYGLSAFWHGFYPGYYLFSLSFPLVTVCERLGKNRISPFFAAGNLTLYNMACCVCTSLLIQYLSVAFLFLSLERVMSVWRSFYFLGHAGCFLFYCIVLQLPKPKTV